MVIRGDAAAAAADGLVYNAGWQLLPGVIVIRGDAAAAAADGLARNGGG